MFLSALLISLILLALPKGINVVLKLGPNRFFLQGLESLGIPLLLDCLAMTEILFSNCPLL